MPRSKHRRHKTPERQHPRRRRAVRRGHWLRGLLVAMAILAVPAAWMAMEAYQARIRADLSVLGSGVPVVVQVHDQRSRESRRLHDRVAGVLEGVEPALEWRVVDVNSEAGRRLAREYGADRLTLLLFDGRGELVQRLRGDPGGEVLEAAFVDLAGGRGDPGR